MDDFTSKRPLVAKMDEIAIRIASISRDLRLVVDDVAMLKEQVLSLKCKVCGHVQTCPCVDNPDHLPGLYYD
jgi:hypothetical protein